MSAESVVTPTACEKQVNAIEADLQKCRAALDQSKADGSAGVQSAQRQCELRLTRSTAELQAQLQQMHVSQMQVADQIRNLQTQLAMERTACDERVQQSVETAKAMTAKLDDTITTTVAVALDALMKESAAAGPVPAPAGESSAVAGFANVRGDVRADAGRRREQVAEALRDLLHKAHQLERQQRRLVRTLETVLADVPRDPPAGSAADGPWLWLLLVLAVTAAVVAWLGRS